MVRSSIIHLALLCALLLLTFSIYSWGVNGPFLLDDFSNLSAIGVGGGVAQIDDVLRYVFGNGGDEFSRSLTRATFLINAQHWPASPYLFKLTNIVLHLLNGLLLAFLLLRLLLNWLDRVHAERVVLLCVAFWLLHPMHVSTVLYVVQRMTQLMVFFFLLSLIFYTYFRSSKNYTVSVLCLGLSAIAALLSVLAKENGAILLLLYPLIEFGFYTDKGDKFRWASRLVASCSGVLFVVVFILAAIGRNEGYEGRFYTLWQRIQVEGGVVFDYLYSFAALSLEGGSLFHDDVEYDLLVNGAGYSGAYWLLLGTVGWLAWKLGAKYRLVLLGYIWFLVGHVIESTFIPLELKFEHRNYLPYIGLALALAYWVVSLADRFKRRYGRLALMIVVVPLALEVVFLLHRVGMWTDHRILNHKWATEQPESLRAQFYRIKLLEVDGFYLAAVKESIRVEEIFEDKILPLNRIRLECEYGIQEPVGELVDINDFKRVNYTSGVAGVVSDILRLESDCIEGKLLNGTLADLLQAIESMPLLKSKKRDYAGYLDIIDDYYIKNYQYSKAVMVRERMWEAQPTVNTAFMLVEIFIQGGNYEMARYYLDWAIAKNERLWFSDGLVISQINFFEEVLGNVSSHIDRK